jgi:MFS superfamily sulfate permease-like transporter
MAPTASSAELWGTSHIEFAVCMVAMLDVLIVGVLPGVGLAIGLALAWLLNGAHNWLL